MMVCPQQVVKIIIYSLEKLSWAFEQSLQIIKQQDNSIEQMLLYLKYYILLFNFISDSYLIQNFSYTNVTRLV